MLVWDTTREGIHLFDPFLLICLDPYIFIAELQSTIQFDPGFVATLIFHPATYLNKVLVSSVQGEIQLWNIRTQSVQWLIISKITYKRIDIQKMHP